MTYTIAIDGPSGAGKSTIAKALADALDILYIDTGAMYRAVAFLVKKYQINNEQAIIELLNKHTISFIDGSVAIDQEIVESDIRTEEISKITSKLSQLKTIRAYLVELQQQMANHQSVVMEGRDIGTVVLPDADYKFFLTADVEIRAKRRFEQSKEQATYEQVLKDIKDRDYRDMNRKISPLTKAADAIVINSSDLSIEDVVEKMKSYIREGEDAL